jgi:hypothetical protein
MLSLSFFMVIFGRAKMLVEYSTRHDGGRTESAQFPTLESCLKAN